MIFLKTLSLFYYERMIANAPSDFTKMVNMGMALEEGVHEGRLSKEEYHQARSMGAVSPERRKVKPIQYLWGGRGGLI